MTNDVEARAVPHAWVPSTLGHGETMCSRCKITNREAAVLGELNTCSDPAALQPADPVAGEVASIIKKLRSSAKAFRENPIYSQDGDPVFLTVQAEECEHAADMLAAHQQPPAGGDAETDLYGPEYMRFLALIGFKKYREAWEVAHHAPARDAALREAAAVAQFVADHERAPQLADVAVAIRAGILARVGSDDVAGVEIPPCPPCDDCGAEMVQTSHDTWECGKACPASSGEVEERT